MILNIKWLQKIVSDALQYPSGDNCQPFTFIWKDEKLDIFLDPERSSHPLNPQEIASQISLGCLIESLAISASQFGYELQVHYHSAEAHPQKSWATIEFHQASLGADPLLEALPWRTTDRRLYEKAEIPSSVRNLIEDSQQKIGRLHWIESIPQTLTEYIAEADTLMAYHPTILPKILKWTRFTKNEALQTRDGLSLSNMGIRIHEIPVVYLIRSFPKTLKLFSFPFASQQKIRTREQVNASSGLICLSIPRNSQSQIAEATRPLFRVWLQLTLQGFAAQPLSIPSMYHYGVMNHLVSDLPSEKWKKFFKEKGAILREAFAIPKDREALWMIRVGKATPLPSEMRTLRRSLESVLRVI